MLERQTPTGERQCIACPLGHWIDEAIQGIVEGWIGCAACFVLRGREDVLADRLGVPPALLFVECA